MVTASASHESFAPDAIIRIEHLRCGASNLVGEILPSPEVGWVTSAHHSVLHRGVVTYVEYLHEYI